MHYLSPNWTLAELWQPIRTEYTHWANWNAVDEQRLTKCLNLAMICGRLATPWTGSTTSKARKMFAVFTATLPNFQETQVLVGEYFNDSIEFMVLLTGVETAVGVVDVKSSPVYFHVQRNSTYSLANTTIPFQIERLNVGGAMNISSGIFTAPTKSAFDWVDSYSKIVVTTNFGSGQKRPQKNVSGKKRPRSFLE